MSRIKIFEMFLRDGLQSYKTIFNVPQKLSFLNHLNTCNYDCIEFGSTTSPKLIPQIGGSYELWDKIKTQSKKKTRYTMLVPSENHLKKVMDEGITSYGLVTSLSDEFSQRNMKMTGEQSLNKAIEMIQTIIESNKTDNHIRVYISCSFGCPWEGFTKFHIIKLKYFIDNLVDMANKNNLSNENFDIVIADTVGMCDENRMKELLELNKDNKYLGLHLHFLSEMKNERLEQKFEKVVDIALNLGVEKFDTSLLGIGGCPYAKKKEGEIIGNLSTVPFIRFLEKKGLVTNLYKEQLESIEEQIYKEITAVDTF